MKIDNSGLWESTPESWYKVKYCDYLSGKNPEVDSVFWFDDQTQLPKNAKYINGKYTDGYEKSK